MNPDIKTIIDFIAQQMDDGTVPANGSPALEQLGAAIGNLQRHNSRQELAFLGLSVLGVAIERAHSSIAAENTLRTFIQRGRDHD